MSVKRISFLSFARVRAKTGKGGGGRNGGVAQETRKREKERVRSISPRVLPRSFPPLSIKLSWVMSGGEALEKAMKVRIENENLCFW